MNATSFIIDLTTTVNSTLMCLLDLLVAVIVAQPEEIPETIASDAFPPKTSATASLLDVQTISVSVVLLGLYSTPIDMVSPTLTATLWSPLLERFLRSPPIKILTLTSLMSG